MTEPVIIEDYDQHWPAQFERIRSKIAPVLAPLAAAIEHVGSTAVPGLAAKPIIDVDVLLRTPGDLAEVIVRLSALGYRHRGDLGVSGREAFEIPHHHDVRHHLYVCMPDSSEYCRHLALRDHLRDHPDDARGYALLKRKLAAEFGSDREAYTRAKGPFIEDILRRTMPPAS